MNKAHSGTSVRVASTLWSREHKKITTIVMKRNVKRFLIMTALATFVALITVMNISFPLNANISTLTDKELQAQYEGTLFNRDTTVCRQDSLKVILYDEVRKYIDTKTDKAHDELHRYLVDNGLKYDIDICFMMSQTELETNFGTLGAGRTTSRKSLFGVTRSYATYEEAVNDYCDLLTRRYLGGRKTEQDLMNHYVNLSGNRYAQDRGYETKLKRAYGSIRKQTAIYDLQNQLKQVG